MEAKRQIHVLSVKQQLDECTAAIMNPIEGEQEAGGRPFRAGQKAISLVPSLFVCGGACMMHTHTPRPGGKGISQRIGMVYGVENCFQGSWSVLL